MVLLSVVLAVVLEGGGDGIGVGVVVLVLWVVVVVVVFVLALCWNRFLCWRRS